MFAAQANRTANFAAKHLHTDAVVCYWWRLLNALARLQSGIGSEALRTMVESSLKRRRPGMRFVHVTPALVASLRKIGYPWQLTEAEPDNERDKQRKLKMRSKAPAAEKVRRRAASRLGG